MHCGQKEPGYVYCQNGHYICDNCHGKGFFEVIRDLSLSAKGIDPVVIAEDMIKSADVPMLGCEHAWIAAGALLAAIRNHGQIKVSNDQITEALNRTQKQAIGAYCGLTGVCGVAVAIGAAFSTILGASCPKNKETSITMHVVARIVEVIANNTGPCCCKNFVRTALRLGCQLAGEYLDVDLGCTVNIKCEDSRRHPHGCRETRCRYYQT